MQRRAFSTTLAASGLAPLLGGLASGSAQAQGGPVEGQHYVKLSQPAAVAAPTGKIEVVEFFSYGCPHCNALEPTLDEWLKKLPADVTFRRVPVGFNAAYESYQRLFYALEAMGKLELVHKRIFAAIHQQRQFLDKESDQVAFLNANGVDGAAFVKATKEFHVATKVTQAKRLTEAYKIDGVPAIGIQGRFYTAGSLAGDNRRALAVADFLIDRVRKGA